MVIGTFKLGDRVSDGGRMGIRSISPLLPGLSILPPTKQLTLLAEGNLFLPRSKSDLSAGEIQFCDGSEVGALVY